MASLLLSILLVTLLIVLLLLLWLVLLLRTVANIDVAILIGQLIITWSVDDGLTISTAMYSCRCGNMNWSVDYYLVS